MLAIQYKKSIPRFLLMRYIGKKWGRLYTSPLSSIQLIDIPEPQLPTQQWVKVKTRLSGICGSDLATITAKGSTYFSPFTSTPFILGHEIVGEIAEIGKDVNGLSIGDRVVIEPALSCIVREINPPCIQCENSRFSNCENITRGSISEGVQTGYCRDTGGGWSEYVLAHRSQLRILPDDISDELAVILEPFACSLHGVLQIDIKNQKDICVIGSGTIGLLTVSALRLLGYKNRIIVVAKYPHQKKIAQDLGADVVISPDKNRYLTFSELTNAESYQPELGEQVLIGGVDVTFDCIGSSSTIDDALRFTRSGGDVILLGMPGIPKNIDWVSIWYKQLNVKGAYTYGIETYEGEEIHTFDLGLKFLQDSGEQLLPIVGFSFSLKNYKQAIQTSLNTGTSASVKTIFDFR